MNIEAKKVAKILNEMVTFAIAGSAENLNISLENNKEFFKINIKAENIKCPKKCIDNLKRHLSSPRQEAAEEYYWELTGDSDTGSELALVGMMVDEAIIDYDGNNLTIELHRYK